MATTTSGTTVNTTTTTTTTTSIAPPSPVSPPTLLIKGLSYKATYLALHDLELLPYSITVSLFTLIGMIVYRPVNPIIPSVQQMPATLITLTR